MEATVKGTWLGGDRVSLSGGQTSWKDLVSQSEGLWEPHPMQLHLKMILSTSLVLMTPKFTSLAQSSSLTPNVYIQQPT